LDAIYGRIGFLGAGAMAEGLIRGLINHGVPASTVWATDTNHARLQYVAQTLSCNTSADTSEMLSACTTIVLAVKPQVLPAVLQEWSAGLAQKLVISIAAGIGLAQISSLLPPGTAVVRCMPNTPCTVGLGAIGMSASEHCSREHVEMARAILGASGLVVELHENLLDAVTGVSGSGPAYVYTFIEALIDAGVRVGLPRDAARALALQTVAGATELLRQSNAHPAQCRDAVTSPGGTTAAALASLEADGFRAAVMRAVMAATERSLELGRSATGKGGVR
jgi:pyrroline-5-carboxylate reductase